jgi:hypothetical protein
MAGKIELHDPKHPTFNERKAKAAAPVKTVTVDQMKNTETRPQHTK